MMPMGKTSAFGNPSPCSLESFGLPPCHGGAPKHCWALDHHVQWKDAVHEDSAKLLKVDAVGQNWQNTKSSGYSNAVQNFAAGSRCNI